MLAPEQFLPDGQTFSNQLFRFIEFPLVTVNGGKIIKRRCDVRMLIAEERTPDAEGLLMCAFRFRQVAFLPKRDAEIVKRRSCLSTPRSELLSIESQRCSMHFFSVAVFPDFEIESPNEGAELSFNRWLIGHLLADALRCAIENPSQHGCVLPQSCGGLDTLQHVLEKLFNLPALNRCCFRLTTRAALFRERRRNDNQTRHQEQRDDTNRC